MCVMQVEAWRRNADDSAFPPLNLDLFSDDRLVAAEGTLPQIVRENDDRFGVWTILLGGVGAPESGADAEHVEQIGGREDRVNALGARPLAAIHRCHTISR